MSGQQAPRNVNYEDVDELIGLAAQMKNAAEEQLTVDELKAVAQDVGVPEQYVERALSELARRRAAQELAKEQRRKQVRIAGVVGAVLLLLVALSAAMGQSSLNSLQAVVSQRQTQVANVQRRRALVQQRIAGYRAAATARGEPMQSTWEAEELGADNRVAVETRRYDQAVTEYNAKAGSFPGSLWRSVFGMPRALPLSREVAQW